MSRHFAVGPLPSGALVGTVEEAMDCACGLRLDDMSPVNVVASLALGAAVPVRCPIASPAVTIGSRRPAAVAPSSSVETPVRRSRRDVAAVVILTAVLAVLWGRGRHTWYWTDEGLSLGFASHRLSELPELLARDTGAPLYHVLLHGWIRHFGSSEASTHTLSLLFALGVIPASLWAGWSLFDRRTGWVCAALAAVSPFLAIYANETRMYSLVALLSLLTIAMFLHVFACRRRQLLPAFFVLLALTAYTHYWGLFLALGTAAALPFCWAHGQDRRRLAMDAVVGFGTFALLMAPWVPTLLYQRAHSAVPWAFPPTLAQVGDDLVDLVGGPLALVALAVGGGAALVFVLRRPWTTSSLLVVCLLIISLVIVAAGWFTSRTSSQWHGRYLAVVLGPLLLFAGASLARGGDVAVAMLAVVAVLTGPYNVKKPPEEKSNVRRLVDVASPALSPHDLVFAPMGEVPLVAHYLGGGARYLTTTGPVIDPLATDWRDAMARLRRHDPVADVSGVVDGLPAGAHVFVLCPASLWKDLDEWAPFISLDGRRCFDVEDHLLHRPDLQVEKRLPASSRTMSPRAAVLLVKRAASPAPRQL